jgi:acetolactate synthase-1/2/3 large subunit
MKITDFIAKTLKKNGVSSVFGLQGGAVVHIFDSLEKEGINVIYNHHEESAALAAAANSKVTGEIGCAVITTGPGCTNALTGLLGAWQDSIPVIFISGQVRSSHLSYGKKVRQVGTQEANILDIVKPITKGTFLIENKEKVVNVMNDAIQLATSGRPGPVWIDIPLDFQWENIEKVGKINKVKKIKNNPNIKNLDNFKKLYSNSKNPLFVLGYGLRLSRSEEKIKSILRKNNLKAVTTWTAADIFETSDSTNLGIIGMRGQRGANLALFKSDLLICLGTHLSISQTTTLTDTFAPNSKKIIVNIDKDQLNNLNIKFDLKINADLSDFLKIMASLNLKKNTNSLTSDFEDLKSLNWYKPKQDTLPNPNLFFRKLTQKSPKSSAIIVDGGGTALYCGFQSSFLKENQRIICSSAISAMGTGLAETIGVNASNKFKKLYCIIGDGSFLMNIQDLQNIKSENIPVVICVINNNGYLAIRHTQKEFLEGRLYGTHPDWSLKMPDIERLASGFKIDYLKLNHKSDVDFIVAKLNKSKGPIICEVVVEEDVMELFRQGYKANDDGTFTPLPLNIMQPYLKEVKFE